MAYSAVIFDIDGTLVHTMPEYRYELIGKSLKELGAKFSEKAADRFWFEGDRDAIIRECFNLEPKIFWPVFVKNDFPEMRKKSSRAYDDIDIVKELRQKVCKTGIVTGAPPHVVKMNLDLIGEENYDAIVIANYITKIKTKPHPQGLEECLNLLNVDKSEAIYVGNGDEDIMTAKNAEVDSVLLIRGEHDVPNQIPFYTIYSLHDLRKLV
ncbi:hypothetical protein COS75_03025 [Candidatus Pacearchaeota archaeon CG06_land_8_20_14_3_00_35_12]|nr:MAG: hypothetical protein COS75_03025 [Candidatus Pacearchaeota archaeon CG06_land_8_20_14_3_00_35_12]